MLTVKFRHKSIYVSKCPITAKVTIFTFSNLKTFFYDFTWHNYQWNMKFHFVYLTNNDLFDIILVPLNGLIKLTARVKRKGALTRYDRGHFWWVRDTSDRGVSQYPAKIWFNQELHQWRYDIVAPPLGHFFLIFLNNY